MTRAAGSALARLARLPLARLVAVGGACTALYVLLAWIGAERLGMPASLASLAAYAASAGVSYAGHRAFTFRSRRPHRESAWRFGLLAAAGYGVALAAPLALTDWLGAPPLASFLAVSVAVPALNALALSRLVFARALTVPLSR